MDETESLLAAIEYFRERLNDLISKSETLHDPEILKHSKKLDALLTEYEKILKRRKND
jgi:hypothetical protein